VGGPYATTMVNNGLATCGYKSAACLPKYFCRSFFDLPQKKVSFFDGMAHTPSVLLIKSHIWKAFLTLTKYINLKIINIYSI
jgi:hypothetical protein